MKKEKIDYTVGTENVFADLGLPSPDERLAKAELAYQINTLIKQKKLTQIQAAQLLGIDQPKISALNKGKLAGFSFERLFKYLTVLGQNIVITTKPKSRTKAHLSVIAKKITKVTPQTKSERISSQTSR